MTNVVIEITLANIINKREKGMLLYRGNKREIKALEIKDSENILINIS